MELLREIAANTFFRHYARSGGTRVPGQSPDNLVDPGEPTADPQDYHEYWLDPKTAGQWADTLPRLIDVLKYRLDRVTGAFCADQIRTLWIPGRRQPMPQNVSLKGVTMRPEKGLVYVTVEEGQFTWTDKSGGNFRANGPDRVKVTNLKFSWNPKTDDVNPYTSESTKEELAVQTFNLEDWLKVNCHGSYNPYSVKFFHRPDDEMAFIMDRTRTAKQKS